MRGERTQTRGSGRQSQVLLAVLCWVFILSVFSLSVLGSYIRSEHSQSDAHIWIVVNVRYYQLAWLCCYPLVGIRLLPGRVA